jgi:Spy/CpxP family protein refolding chaperone
MKTTKRILISLLLTLLVSMSTSFAQGRGGGNQQKREDIEAMKIAFITQKLELTPGEAQQFWPLYNQYSQKTKELRKKRRQGNREARQQNFDELSDKEVEQLVNDDIANRQKELDLQKEYNEKFKAILPIKKVAKLYAAEEQFKVVLINQLKDRQAGRGQ